MNEIEQAALNVAQTSYALAEQPVAAAEYVYAHDTTDTYHDLAKAEVSLVRPSIAEIGSL